MLLFSGIVLFSGCAGEKEEVTTTTLPEKKVTTTLAPTTTLGKEIKEGKIGEEILAGNVAYTVTELKTVERIGKYMMNKFSGTEAEGLYHLVYLKVENKAGESQNEFTPEFIVVDDQGNEYTAKVSYYVEKYYEREPIKFGKPLEPNELVEGAVAFDIPTFAKGLKLEIRGNWPQVEKIVVDLGK